MTAVASNDDMEEMYPNASIAGVGGYSLLFKITFNNETIPPVVTIILEIYIGNILDIGYNIQNSS